ncbi:hypothetical protein KDA_30250 [Dictyobacter alpinus]|uniref:Uncharacterized protein n=1 Tax=Dictyobacter alpinus TaxID=2014873 RepID=A0A402B838_9CHLR|nr:hypothetical protein KDA_30250 [Dictyobacter alpinus]
MSILVERLIPLDLPEFQVVSQTWLDDGRVNAKVIAKQQTAICPHVAHASFSGD